MNIDPEFAKKGVALVGNTFQGSPVPGESPQTVRPNATKPGPQTVFITDSTIQGSIPFTNVALFRGNTVHGGAVDPGVFPPGAVVVGNDFQGGVEPQSSVPDGAIVAYNKFGQSPSGAAGLTIGNHPELSLVFEIVVIDAKRGWKGLILGLRPFADGE